MKRLCRLASTALCVGATLISSGGCSRGERVPVLRGSEVVFRARRVDGDTVRRGHAADEDGDTIPNRVPVVDAGVLLRVDLAEGQLAEDVHRDGWYVSSAMMSRLFELLKMPSDAE